MVDAEETPLRNQNEENILDTKGGMTEDAIEPQVVLSGVRRRGRRRVLRKKTVKDEEGYLGLFQTTGRSLIYLGKL